MALVMSVPHMVRSVQTEFQNVCVRIYGTRTLPPVLERDKPDVVMMIQVDVEVFGKEGDIGYCWVEIGHPEYGHAEYYWMCHVGELFTFQFWAFSDEEGFSKDELYMWRAGHVDAETHEVIEDDRKFTAVKVG